MTRKSEVRQRGKILALRCTPDEERAIRDAAEVWDVSVAAFLRHAALREAARVIALGGVSRLVDPA